METIKTVYVVIRLDTESDEPYADALVFSNREDAEMYCQNPPTDEPWSHTIHRAAVN